MRILCLTFLLCFIALAAAQELAVEISLARERIYYGEQVQLKIEINGGDAGSTVDITPLAGEFTVEAAGSQSQNRTFIQIINGVEQRSEFRGHLFAYLLSPKKAGFFDIGPLTVTVQGKPVQSNAVTLEVVGIGKQDLAFLKITTSQTEYFIGEKFSVTLEVYLKKLGGSLGSYDPITPRSPLALKIPWLDGLEGLDSPPLQDLVKPYLTRPGLAGFHINDIATRSDNLFSMFDEPSRAVFNLPRTEAKTQNPAGGEGTYWCYKLPVSLCARKVDIYTFGPALLKGVVVWQRTTDAKPEGKEMVSAADALTIHVSDAPLAGRPSSFCGAVGNFSVRVEILPAEVYVGDPLTLVWHVEGEGFWDNIMPPKLAEYAELKPYFTVYADKVTSEQKAGEKTFRYALRARSPEIKEIPALPFAYFDPRTRRYVIAHSRPIPLVVKSTETVKPGEIVSATPAAQATSQEILQKQSRGIFANYTKPDALISMPLGWQIWHIVLLISWPLLYGLVAAGLYYQRRWGSDIVHQRQSRAWKRAQQRIAAAAVNDIVEFYAALRAALLGEVADLYNLPEESLVPAEAVGHLRRQNIDDSLVREISSFLEQCEAAQYGAQAAGHVASLEEERKKAMLLGEKIRSCK
jgi:hypothetical protein